MELTYKPITLRSFILVGCKMYSHIVLATCCNKIPDNSNSERKCSFSSQLRSTNHCGKAILQSGAEAFDKMASTVRKHSDQC